MRKALLIRDRGCTAPGCYCPLGRLEAHHIVHWIDGGATAVNNLVLLCRRHHRFVHEGGWRIALNADGSAEFSPPPLALTG
jgi:5-methylcytosine-specific restriction endonuclease McrA